MTIFSSKSAEWPDDFLAPVPEAYSEADVLRLVLRGIAAEEADSPYSTLAVANSAEDSFYQFLQKRDEYMKESGGEQEFRIGYETAIEDKAAEDRQLSEEIRDSLSTIADLRKRLKDRSIPALEATKAHLQKLKAYEDTSASDVEKWAFEDGVMMTVTETLELIDHHERLIEADIERAQKAAGGVEDNEKDPEDA